MLQVNLCQKLLFLHQLTNNMTTDCSFNYKFNTWKFQAQTWGEHVVYRKCFWHSEQFLYTTCSPHVLQKEELLTKIYLYKVSKLHTYTYWSKLSFWVKIVVILSVAQLVTTVIFFSAWSRVRFASCGSQFVHFQLLISFKGECTQFQAQFCMYCIPRME